MDESIMKWFLLLILGLFVFKVIQNLIKNAHYSKKQEDLNAKYGIGPYHKKARGVRTLSYAAKCFAKGQKKKGIETLEGIASQEGWLEMDSDDRERYYAASILLHLSILGFCDKGDSSQIKFSIEAPEYKNREKAEEIAGWLLESQKRDSALKARKQKIKPEEYRFNLVYFVLALLCTDTEERFMRMKKAVEFHSNEARWWLLRNSLFERAFPDKEQQKREYFQLYYAMEGYHVLWTGHVWAEFPLKRWMILEGGFPEELLNGPIDQLGKETARMMRKDVIAKLILLEKENDSVGKDTLERIERQNKADDEELQQLLEEQRIIKKAADEFNQWMDEFSALRVEEEAESSGKSGTSRKGDSGEFALASIPVLVYDSSNRQWKRRGIYGDHAVYYSDDGDEVTIYSAQVSGKSASTSVGVLHWY